jgi:hypothetical protein
MVKVEAKATVKVEAKATTTTTRAPGPEAATPGTWAEHAGSTQARPARGLVAQAATGAARLSMTYESGKAKAAKTVAARPCRTEKRGGALPPPPVHAVAPPCCTVSWFVLLVAC